MCVFIIERGFFEAVGEPFALHDIERISQAFIVGSEPHQATGERLVRAMPFAGARKGTMQLKERTLGSTAYEPAREESQATRAGGVT